MDFSRIERMTLPNGLRILMLPDDRYRSASMGVWVGSGTRFERDGFGGISHFIEHILFKGTPTHSARDIAEQMDAIGGQMNAYTTKEHTCFYSRCLRENLGVALDIMLDMLTSPKLAPEDIELECGVITEEIGMYEDSPDDLLIDSLYQTIWPDNKLGTNILGTRQSVAATTADMMRQHMAEQYTGRRMVFAIAGSFDREMVVDRVTAALGSLPSGDIAYEAVEAIYHPGISLVEKDFEQLHICLGFPGISLFDEHRQALSLFNSICGGSSSSRLFQHIREERGLAYSVGSSFTSYLREGLFEVDAAVNPEREEEALRAIVGELCRIRRDGVTPEEFERTRNQSKAAILMGLESCSSMASHMARGVLIRDCVRSEEEIIRELEAVTLDEINHVARQFINFDKLALCAVGKVHDKNHYMGIVMDSIF